MHGASLQSPPQSTHEPLDGSHKSYVDKIRLALIAGHHYSMAEAVRACGLYGELIDTGHRVARPVPLIAAQITRRDRGTSSQNVVETPPASTAIARQPSQMVFLSANRTPAVGCQKRIISPI